jgi:hypothetical protein
MQHNRADLWDVAGQPAALTRAGRRGRHVGRRHDLDDLRMTILLLAVIEGVVFGAVLAWGDA